MMAPIVITKADGSSEVFDPERLIRSLRRSGAGEHSDPRRADVERRPAAKVDAGICRYVAIELDHAGAAVGQARGNILNVGTAEGGAFADRGAGIERAAQ